MDSIAIAHSAVPAYWLYVVSDMLEDAHNSSITKTLWPMGWVILGNVEVIWGYLVPSWGHLGQCQGQLGAILGGLRV